MKVIRGRKALVTGAASGIGRSIALALAREGAELFLVDVDQTALVATTHEAKQHGVEVVAVACDLAEPAQISAAVKSLLFEWGELAILVNNAGVAYHGPTHLMTKDAWNRIFAVNLLAPAQLVRELLPVLGRQDEAHILNVCSFLGLVTMRNVAAYQASKFGLVGLSSALRAEYGGRGIGVTALCPGFVRSAMLDRSRMGRDGNTRPPCRRGLARPPTRLPRRQLPPFAGTGGWS